jgi:hypothetical protein
LSSIKRATACTFSVSLADGGGSLRIWLLSGWNAERNERLQAAGLVLQRARLHQVIDALLHRLDVAVQHRDVGAHAEAMRDAMDREISRTVALVVANLLAHARREDFGATARQ